MRWKAIAAVSVCFAVFVSAGAARPGARLDPSALLARYEPVIELYRSDWKPSAIESYLAAADLERFSAGRWRVVRRSPSASALSGGSSSLRLDTRGCTPAADLDACYPRRAAPATVYGRVWVSPNASAAIATVLQYWLFYPLDDWRNSLKAPTLWYMHEGDWEQVSVGLDAGGRPVSMAASQHDLGVLRPWSRVRVTGATHPVVYSALGSHANYLAPGFRGSAGVPHVIPPRFSGVPFREPDFTAAQSSYGPAEIASNVLAVIDVSGGTAPWLSFAGSWGDGSYILAGERTKHGLSFVHLRIGGSPSGPAFHGVWRDPSLPFRTWPADDEH